MGAQPGQPSYYQGAPAEPGYINAAGFGQGLTYQLPGVTGLADQFSQITLYLSIKEGEGLIPASQKFGVCSPGRILAMERSMAAAVVHIGPSYLNVYFYE